ncbi:MAG: hypothetical protein WCI80_01290 [Bacteroidota bacterium]
MSLNQILAISEAVGINDHRFIGTMISRNQRISTSEIMTVVPFNFDMKPMNYLLYSQNRALLNSLRIPDMALEQYLNFGTTGWVNYIAYQGDMTSGQLATCQYQTSTTIGTKNIILGNLPSISSALYVVKQGDFLQIDRYAYIATADVLRGSGTTVTIPVHRNILTQLTSVQNAVIGQYGTTISLGGSTYTGITFCVILRAYPTYTLMPITNDSFIQWSGAFTAFENVLP